MGPLCIVLLTFAPHPEESEAANSAPKSVQLMFDSADRVVCKQDIEMYRTRACARNLFLKKVIRVFFDFLLGFYSAKNLILVQTERWRRG